MAPKWNPIVVEEDHGVTEVYEDGRLMPGLNVAMVDEDVERMRQGYKCIRCWEPFESAWPRYCNVCGFPVGKHQAEHFARAYKGYDPTIRTGADLEAVADAMEERQERRAFARRAKESGISLAGKSVGEAIKRMKGGS
jgi:hypothetical protein